MHTMKTVRWATCLSLICILALGCSAPPTDQGVEGEMQMLVVSGNNQSGTVATELAKSVVIQVVKNGRPVSGQTVNFVVTTASDPLNTRDAGADAAAIPSIADTQFKGRVFAGTAVTDTNGRAEDFWTLGARTSYPQTLEARAADPTNGKQIFAAFSATALPGPAYQMILNPTKPVVPVVRDGGTPIDVPAATRDGGVDGGAGGVDAGTPAPLTEVVAVYDQLSNPVSGVSVRFAVTGGAGSVTPSVVKTGASGTAQATWTLGTSGNTQNTLSITAPVTTGSPVTVSSYVGCSTGLACSSGSGVCVDVAHDQSNCGWCGNQCPESSSCVNGSCQCAGGTIDSGALSFCSSMKGGPSACVDLQHDSNNCGFCGRQCSSPTACVNGMCQCAGSAGDGGVFGLCSSGGVSACVDLQRDPNNCGWCGNQCSSSTVCVSGRCQCASDSSDAGVKTVCSQLPGVSVCVDLLHDPNNCGGCGRQCPAPSTCVNGGCSCAASGGDPDATTFCDLGNGAYACVDARHDPNNCGWCGHQCPAQSTCVNGGCSCTGTSADPDATTLCDLGGAVSACVDVRRDPNNCGNCGNQCLAGSSCVEGICQCPGGMSDGGALSFCPGQPGRDPACVDLWHDSNNCGYCGNRCSSSSSCIDGSCRCANSGMIACGGPAGVTCIDVQSDSANCGYCGNRCPGSTTCVAGRCQCAGGGGTACQVAGSITCVDLQNDSNNCGNCGNTCPTGDSYLCKEGQCVFCPADTIYCSNMRRCVYPLSDPQNCGGCGNVCSKPNSYCSLGECTCGGATDCGKACANLDNDPDNCGGCGNVCGPTKRLCAGQTCQPCSNLGAGYGECQGKCTDLRFDDNNCGTCDKACGVNATCIQGVCVAGQ